MKGKKMLKRVDYVFDNSVVFIVNACDDEEALRQVRQIHHDMRELEYYEEEELEDVDNLEYYEVNDIEGWDIMYELKRVLDYAVENSADVTMVDDVIVMQRY